VTVYGAAFQHPDGSTRLVADDSGRVVLFALASLAALFAVALRLRGADVHVVPLSPSQVADVLLAAGVGADDLDATLALVEAATEDPADAVRWTRELAGRVPLATVT
jgi:hypothetical protein